MKGRSRTKADERLHDRIAQLGCLPCRKDGLLNDYVSIHHIAGRTAPGAHKKVLALCFEHHQGGRTVPAVHTNKKGFVARYGSEMELLAETMQMLEQ